MKKSLLLVFAAASVLAACNNAETDSRINRLEQRIAALEGGNQKTVAADDHAGHDHAATDNNFSQLTAGQSGADQAGAAPSGPTAKIEYKQTEYDWGTVKEGTVVTHTFKFKNTGSVPLVIQNAQASCGCTVPKKPENPIPPGQEGEIEVRFDSATRPGIQNKTITVTANTDPAVTRLTIKGTVDAKAGASTATATEGPVRN